MVFDLDFSFMKSSQTVDKYLIRYLDPVLFRGYGTLIPWDFAIVSLTTCIFSRSKVILIMNYDFSIIRNFCRLKSFFISAI